MPIMPLSVRDRGVERFTEGPQTLESHTGVGIELGSGVCNSLHSFFVVCVVAFGFVAFIVDLWGVPTYDRPLVARVVNDLRSKMLDWRATWVSDWHDLPPYKPQVRTVVLVVLRARISPSFSVSGRDCHDSLLRRRSRTLRQRLELATTSKASKKEF